MTLATMLEHVGVTVPRFVAVDGRVVLDPTGTPSPLAVQPHRFHGGDDPAPDRVDYTGAWWNTEPDARVADKAEMALHFPDFTCVEEDGDYFYFGEINTGRGRFKVLLLPHVDRSLPTVVPRTKSLGRRSGQRLQRPPHLYDSGRLCIADASDWDPSVHGTATATAWTAHWFAAYTEWWIKGRWPTEGFGAAA